MQGDGNSLLAGRLAGNRKAPGGGAAPPIRRAFRRWWPYLRYGLGLAVVAIFGFYFTKAAAVWQLGSRTGSGESCILKEMPSSPGEAKPDSCERNGSDIGRDTGL